MRMLHPSYRQNWRSGFTLVELLVVIAIIGVLIGLLLPTVQAAREASRAIQCKNHMRQIALALAQHEESKGAYPPARLETHPEHPWEYYCCGREPSWYARVLPFLEQQQLADQWRLKTPFSQHPEATRMTVVSTFLCPSRRSPDEATAETKLYDGDQLPCGCENFRYQIGGALGDYGASHGDGSNGAFGVATDFYHGGNGSGIIISARTLCGIDGFSPGELIDKIAARHVTDGLSNTIILGEMHIPEGQLGRYPDNAPIFDGDHLFASARVGGPGYPIGSGPRDKIAQFMSFGSWHPGGCNFSFADGSVRAFQAQIDSILLGRLTNRNDGSDVRLPP